MLIAIHVAISYTAVPPGITNVHCTHPLRFAWHTGDTACRIHPVQLHEEGLVPKAEIYGDVYSVSPPAAACTASSLACGSRHMRALTSATVSEGISGPTAGLTYRCLYVAHPLALPRRLGGHRGTSSPAARTARSSPSHSAVAYSCLRLARAPMY